MESKSMSKNILETEKISRLLMKFAIPGIISMVVNSFYNIVDQIFIGRGVGYLGNGATTVIFPLTAFAMAFALLMGDGAASYLSLMLGKKKEKDAAEGAAAGIAGIVGVGIIVCLVYNIWLKQWCLLFGASKKILPYAMDYGRIISWGIPFLCICAGIASIIRADGSPKYNMAGLLLGCILNLIFDPIFIFVCHWGVKGAAFATIIGQFANAVMNIVYIFRMKSVKVTRETFQNCYRSIGKVARLGVSSFITQIAFVIAMATRNNVLVTYGAQSKYGEDIPVTTLGITMKVFSILMSIVMGLSSGAQPILGYNYGSGQFDRVKKTFRYVLTLATIVMSVAFLIAQLAPMAVIGIFGSDSDLYNEFAVKCMRIYLMLIPIGALPMVSGVFFQSLGYPVQSSLISLSKQIIFQLPATLLLPLALGVEGVLWAGPVSDIMAFIMALVLLLVYWKKMFPVQKEKQQT